MTAGDRKNAIIPLIRVCTDGLTFLLHMVTIYQIKPARIT